MVSRLRTATLWLALSSIDDVEVAEVSSRAVLLGAALVAGVELDQLPSIDHEGRQSELDSLKSSCCDRF